MALSTVQVSGSPVKDKAFLKASLETFREALKKSHFIFSTVWILN